MKPRLHIKASVDGGVGLVRVLLLGVFVSVLVSTSISIAFEFASYLTFALLPEPRRRLLGVWRNPAVIGLAPLAIVVIAATFYGPAAWHDSLHALAGWRRILLLPLAAAVFDDAASKRLVLKTIVVACLLATLASGVIVALLNLPSWLGRGVVFQNYAVQGVASSIAIIVCIAAIMRPDAFAGDRLLGDRRVMVAASAAMMIDVVFVLTGRSGYLALMVMAVVVVTLLAAGSWRAKAAAGLGVLVCVGLVLVSSAHVRERFEQVVHEIETVDQAPQASSIGYRVVFWRNALRMIRDHPILGVGTGGFQDGYRPYIQGVPGWQGQESGDPHNQFLKITTEQGLIGLLAFLFFIGRVLACPAPTPYRQLAVAALIGLCATSLASSHFSTFPESRILFFWLGAMLAGADVRGQVA